MYTNNESENSMSHKDFKNTHIPLQKGTRKTGIKASQGQTLQLILESISLWLLDTQLILKYCKQKASLQML